MAFSVNTNLGALQAYNALAKVNAETQKAQLRLATTKRINSVADDTSGFNVGKQMEAQVLKQKAQLNNVSSAKNLLSTAESALQQINDKLNQVSAKYTDAQDPLKDQASIANDITTLATEIKSILQTTNINGTKLLVKQDDATLAATDKSLDVGGAAFSVDFGSLMGTVALLAKVDALTVGTSTVDEAGAVDAGKTAARAYLVATFVPAVQTKMTEFGLSGTQSTNFSTVMLASYDANITAGMAINDAFDAAYTTAAADGGSGNVAGAVAQGVQTSGTAAYDYATAIANLVYADAATSRADGAEIGANIATKLAEYGSSAADIAAFQTAFGTSLGAVADGGLDNLAHTQAAISAAVVAGNAAMVSHDVAAATAQGVVSTGTAALDLSASEASFKSAFDVAYAGYAGSANTAATVITAASDVTAVSSSIRDALGRIGNLSQSIDSRSEFLTSSIANSTASISSIFDADMAAEQLNATKGNIAGQIGTAMLSQLNSAPQNLLSLFR